MSDTSSAAPPQAPVPDPNGPSATHGQGLLHRVEARRAELARHLGALETLVAAKREHAGRADIEEALAAVDGLLTGDRSNIAEPTATQLNQWLETSRFLCDDEATATAAKAHVKAEARADARAARIAHANALAGAETPSDKPAVE